MGVTVVDNTAFLVVKKSIFNNKEGIRRGLLDVGPEIEREIVRLIESPPKTGRLYLIGGRIHRASAWGESPATLTGTLADSVGFSVTSPTQLVMGYQANVAPYGKWLEGHWLNRPALKPGSLNKAREVEQAILLGVKRQLGKKL